MAPDASGAWVVHKSPDGREYYFNKALNKTTWDKPEELKSADERTSSALPSDWKEFTTDSGKKYYYNSATKQTQWTEPVEAKGAADSPAAAAVAAPSPAEVAAAAKAAAAEDAAAAEERRQFIEMLEATPGVAPEMSWEDAMRLIINNPLYRVIKTLAERKTAFRTWSDEKVRKVEDARRSAQRMLKVDFLQMLKECDELTSRTRFQKVAALFDSDKRWSALDDELEREELFEEYSLSLERKELAERRAKRKERMAEFRALLLATPAVASGCQWRRVQPLLEGQEAFRVLDKIDRLEVFEEYVRELDTSAEQSKLASREATRRTERLQRDAFRGLLLRKHHEGLIGPRTKWRDVLEELKPTDEYVGAVSQSGSTPAELFEDVLESINQEYSAHRRRVKAALSAAKFEIGLTTTGEELAAAIASVEPQADGANGAAAAGEGAPPGWAIAAYLSETVERLSREQAEEQRRVERIAAEEQRRVERIRRSQIDSYSAALIASLGSALSASTTFEEAEAALAGKSGREGKPSGVASMSEEEQRAFFVEVMAGLSGAGEGEAAEEGGGRSKRSRREKRSRSRSRSDEERRRKKKHRHRHRDRSRDRSRSRSRDRADRSRDKEGDQPEASKEVPPPPA